MTNLEKKDLIQGLIDKMTKSNEREVNLKKELSDDNLTLTKVQEMMDNNESLPIDSPYDSFEDWVSSIEKEIATSLKSLAKINEQKIHIEALQYYIDNFQE